MRSGVKRPALRVLRGYGAAGPCSSVGKAAGPLINGTAINGVVVALVGPVAVELRLLTTTAGATCCWPIATDNAPMVSTPLPPISATSSSTLLRLTETILGTPHLPGFCPCRRHSAATR